MDPLTQLMLQRQLAQGAPPQAPQGGVPVTLPASAGKTHTPPEMQRFQNAQALIQAYRNNWAPNPVLLQASQK